MPKSWNELAYSVIDGLVEIKLSSYNDRQGAKDKLAQFLPRDALVHSAVMLQ